MAVLSDNDRADVWAALMRATPTPATSKPQFRAAVNAADDWVESHFADYLSVIPASLRTTPSGEGLLANVALAASGGQIADASAGIDRSKSLDIIAGYTAAIAWLNTNAASYLTAVGTAAAGTLSQAQSFAVLEAVARRKAVV